MYRIYSIYCVLSMIIRSDKVKTELEHECEFEIWQVELIKVMKQTESQKRKRKNSDADKEINKRWSDDMWKSIKKVTWGRFRSFTPSTNRPVEVPVSVSGPEVTSLTWRPVTETIRTLISRPASSLRLDLPAVLFVLRIMWRAAAAVAVKDKNAALMSVELSWCCGSILHRRLFVSVQPGPVSSLTVQSAAG